MIFYTKNVNYLLTLSFIYQRKFNLCYKIKNAQKGIFHNQPAFLNLFLNNNATPIIEVIATG